MTPTQELELIQYAYGIEGSAFIKGITDCNIIVAKVLDIHQQTTLYELAGEYKQYKKGMRLFKDKTGYNSMLDYMKVHCVKVDACFALAGDIIHHDTNDHFDSFAVHLGDSVLFPDDVNNKVTVIRNKTYHISQLDVSHVYRPIQESK